jgi:D-3-phosphoglycerate dehydrogenase
MDQAAFARMKPGAVLVNTARGSLVDEAALIAALQSGRLAGAGLDVFETEPMPAGHRLLGLPNTVLTPHVACGTHDAFSAKMDAIFANVQRLIAGAPLRNLVF